MVKKIVSMLLLGVMLLSLAGCGGEKQSAAGSGSSASKEKVLKVVASHGNKEKIFEAFTKDTGVRVEFLDMSSGEVLARAQAEGGKPMADAWFGGGIDSFIDAKNKGLLESYASKEMDAIPAELRDKDSCWYGMSLVMVGFIVNKEILQQKGLPMPKTWTALADPMYKGEILMANPSVSGTNYGMLSCILQSRGADAGWKYFAALAQNVPFFSKRGGEPPMKVAAGEAAIGVIPYTGEYFPLKEKAPVELYLPEDGVPWVPAGLAIFKNAENMDSARIFIDWVLSKKGQETIRDLDPRIMARTDVAAPELMGSFSRDQLMKADIEVFGTERQATLDTWESRILKK